MPPDNVLTGDLVVDRSVQLSVHPRPEKVNSTGHNSTSAQSSLLNLIARLESLEALDEAHRRRLDSTQARLDALVASSGPVAGSACSPQVASKMLLAESLGGDVKLLCAVLRFLDPKARANVRMASHEVHAVFRGAQVVVSATPRGAALPPLELQSARLMREPFFAKEPVSFFAQKTAVKVVSLKVGEEVFFRPNLMFAKVHGLVS